MLPHHYSRHFYRISFSRLQNDRNVICQQFIAVEKHTFCFWRMYNDKMILCCPIAVLCYFLLISRFILLKIGKIEYFWRFYAKKIIFHIFVVILQLISHYYIITEFSHVGKFSFLLLTLYLWFSRNIFVTL